MRVAKPWIVLSVFAVATTAYAAALTKWQSLDPPVRNTVPASLLMMKGQGTDNLYPPEVDQTTGAIPVEIVGGGGGGGVVTQGTVPWIVAGQGTAGSAATGVVTIQGIAGGTAVPISGSITATNASVGLSGSTAPTSATEIGGVDQSSGHLIGANVDAQGNLQNDPALGTPAVFQEGSIAAASLTTSYATLLNPASDLIWLGLRNNTNGVVVISVGGSTTSFTLDPGDAISLDLQADNSSVESGIVIEAKYTGSAPTSGSIRANGIHH